MIEVDGLVKTYGFRQTTLALDHLSFSVPPKAHFGILGVDGAGKSTLLRILATVERPTEGTIRIGGHNVLEKPTEVRKLLGYMPQALDLRGWTSGSAYLHFWARVSGMPSESQQDRIRAVVDFLGIGGEIEGHPTMYTVDVERRINLAQALLTDPEVLLLDEPLRGLAEAARRFLTERLDRLGQDGKTIVLSSPLLADVRATCDQVAVMSEGRLTRLFGMNELLVKIGQGKDARIFLDIDALPPAAVAALKSLKGVVEVKTAPTATIVYVTPAEVDLEAIRRTLEAQGVQVRGMREAQLGLGDVFSALNA